MKRTILAFALSAGVLLFAAGPADAQYRVPTYSYSFNPWGPTPGYGMTTYSPYTGIGTRSYAYDPWTGTQFYQSNFANPVTGYRRSYSSAYDPFFNQYQYRYNYNYGYPRAAWQYGYWR